MIAETALDCSFRRRDNIINKYYIINILLYRCVTYVKKVEKGLVQLLGHVCSAINLVVNSSFM